ncbi:ABC transporter ATP-binding protein [Butyrivibrio sp. FCS006]|uniref:ABC transporter ATP-binding protein n=1 Tax=Butyrivibrio sp. FCS006 TaxID=1280684 RepID=UPI0003FA5EB4|nr:ABC transporter ATP-binding protein [Butyrivibrio sp. FCS006]
MQLPYKKANVHLFIEVFKTMKWALNVLKNYQSRLYLYIVILILQAVYQIYMTSRIGNIVDLALEDNISKMLGTGLILLGLYIANIIISIISNRFACRNYNGMYNDLELKIYRKIMDASWQELSDYHSGDLITRLSSDIKTIAGNTSGLVPTLIAELTLITSAGIYMIYLDYSMVFLAIVIAPIVIIASRIFMGKIYESEGKIREIESKINSYNVETFENIQAVKAFGIKDYFYDRMNRIEIDRKKIDLTTNKYIMSSYAASSLAGIAAAFILFIWMFYRVHSGVISFGSLSVIAFLALQIARAMEKLLDLIPTIMAYMAASDRVKKLLLIPDEKNFDSEENKKLLSDIANKGFSIYIKDMYFKYKNDYDVFEGANLTAGVGETIAIIGPSGEGKTTMLRVLLGIVTANCGKVYISDGDREVNMGILTRPIVSYVPQTNTMMAGTIRENLKMIRPEISDDEIYEALKIACIYDFVVKLPNRLDHMLGQNGQGLSEGQNQRLAIARALLKRSPILLLDEATSAIDVATERRIIDNIRTLYPQKIIILTTHRPTVLSKCDRVYRIADKKTQVVEQADIQRLIDEF